MSDAGRKNFSDKASEALKPDSQKGYVEKGKETVTDMMDQGASKGQPNEDKGMAQKISDAFGSSKK